MWTKLFQTFRSNRVLRLLFQEFGTILDDGKSMYSKVLAVLHEEKNASHAHDFIYETDIRINRTEQEIRRKIIEHLSLTGVVDLPAVLILMSVLKDAERIGDYCKNMYEVARKLDKAEAVGPYWDKIKSLQYDVVPMFDTVKNAFLNSEKDTAQKEMEEMRRIAHASDEIIDDLYTTQLSARQAIGFALLSRYCKRVSSHLGNIASSVVVPLPLLDFLDEPRESASDEKP